MFFPFNSNVPNGPDDPADDQPDMKTNNRSTFDLLDIDHFTFNDADFPPGNNNNGYHKFLTMFNQENPGFPYFSSSGTLFSELTNGDAWPSWVNKTTGMGVSLLSGVPLLAQNGYVYLPGNILMQWGRANTSPETIVDANGKVSFKLQKTFPINFNGKPYCIFTQPIMKQAFPSNMRLIISITNPHESYFSYKITFINPPSGGSGGTEFISKFYWVAIGSGEKNV